MKIKESSNSETQDFGGLKRTVKSYWKQRPLSCCFTIGQLAAQCEFYLSSFKEQKGYEKCHNKSKHNKNTSGLFTMCSLMDSTII